MNELILLKSGEIALKGLNRSTFEDILIRNAKRALKRIGSFKFYKAQSTIYAEPLEECDLDKAVARLAKVFGFAGLSRALIVEKNLDTIMRSAATYLADDLENAKTFKVTAKRADKKFLPTTPELCRELGHYLQERFPHLQVDVHNPEVTVTVEVRDFAAYIHKQQQPGAGGIPVGSNGNAALLLSGGIDSPVAGYMMAKRGLRVLGVHFVSPPYTSERAQLKVEQLCEKMAPWCGRIQLYIVPFTALQERIRERCPEELFTIIMRRYMMIIAQRIAADNQCGALITGESVGQVASQTLAAIACTEAVCSIPVLRPVIGMDKEEIVAVARRIDTFETSIQPFDDCCTVFTPRHPRTRPQLAEIIAAEALMDSDALVEQAVENARFKLIDG